MRVALEIAGEYRLMHSLEIPGLCARGKDVSSLSMQLRAEARRLQLCHSWLPCLPVTICMVEERLEMPAPPAAAFSWLLAGDLEWDAGCLQAACRMLNEEAAQLRSCYDSYPDVDYDYSADRPENGKTGSAGSARAQLEGFIGRLQPYWALYGLELAAGRFLARKPGRGPARAFPKARICTEPAVLGRRGILVRDPLAALPAVGGQVLRRQAV